MRTLKLTIAYDGTRYAGWQSQTGTRQTPARRWRTPGRAAHSRLRKQKPTIQETLETALQTVLRQPVKVVGSGRTDAGVHAEGQVAHIRIHSPMPAGRLLRAANALLPSDIAVTGVEDAAPAFHARFQARRKRYRYRLYTGDVAPPFIRPYVHELRAPLSFARMRREAAALTGRHDFRAFARVPERQGGTTRTLYDVRIRRWGPEIACEFEGNGFLYTMVRSMVGTLVDVGRGRLPTGTVRRMLRSRRRELAGTTAPAKGLTLVSVAYH